MAGLIAMRTVGTGRLLVALALAVVAVVVVAAAALWMAFPQHEVVASDLAELAFEEGRVRELPTTTTEPEKRLPYTHKTERVDNDEPTLQPTNQNTNEDFKETPEKSEDMPVPISVAEDVSGKKESDNRTEARESEDGWFRYAGGLEDSKELQNELYRDVERIAEIADRHQRLTEEAAIRRFDEHLPDEENDVGTLPAPADDHESHSPMFAFLRRKLQELQHWVSTDEDISPDVGSSSVTGAVLGALDRAMAEGDPGVLLTKLRELYYDATPAGPSAAVVSNSSSLVSLGLLAVDVLLLHNVQTVAWQEQPGAARQMLADPEVRALHSLFVLPGHEEREAVDEREGEGEGEGEGESESESEGGLREFLNSVLGAATALRTLASAYRRGDGHMLDCVWTLYCRGLDKTAASLTGPYGLLAKVNSLGLRLLMGEFPLERALEMLVREATGGWGRIDCPKLFPRCGVAEAQELLKGSRDKRTLS